ncbi:MAG: hypothetical protein H8E34_12170 [Bacteroidetes bacterium]|nr:hypothetical protein [Bacteroidota bacterium]
MMVRANGLPDLTKIGFTMPQVRKSGELIGIEIEYMMDLASSLEGLMESSFTTDLEDKSGEMMGGSCIVGLVSRLED